MNYSYFYKKLDFPPIPKKILDNIESSLTNIITIDDIGYGRVHIKNDKKLTACGYSMADVVNEDLRIWLEENIPNIETRFNILFQTQNSKNNLPSTHIVHTDRERLTALNYIINEGGDDVITSWYREVNKNLLREKKESGSQSDSGSVYYKDLTLLKSVRLKKDHWYIINTRILHDVDNIEDVRKSLSISFRHRNYFI